MLSGFAMNWPMLLTSPSRETRRCTEILNESTKYLELSPIRVLAKPAHENRVRLGAATDTVLPVCGLIRESLSDVASADEAVRTLAAQARNGHKAAAEVQRDRLYHAGFLEQRNRENIFLSFAPSVS
jgi:hypothetical protein